MELGVLAPWGESDLPLREFIVGRSMGESASEGRIGWRLWARWADGGPLSGQRGSVSMLSRFLRRKENILEDVCRSSTGEELGFFARDILDVEGSGKMRRWELPDVSECILICCNKRALIASCSALKYLSVDVLLVLSCRSLGGVLEVQTQIRMSKQSNSR